MTAEAKRISRSEIPQALGRVIDQGGDLRILDGADHGLRTSVMVSVVVPGSGPVRHRHPHAEVFVIHEGSGRFEIEGRSFEAGATDVVIIPPNLWHVFVATGEAPLRLVAIHENSRAVIEREDGSRRE